MEEAIVAAEAAGSIMTENIEMVPIEMMERHEVQQIANAVEHVVEQHVQGTNMEPLQAKTPGEDVVEGKSEDVENHANNEEVTYLSV
mmetsp:Transcript_2913/g.3872  ORF Transcript_2913/g.3872 Transcript_2913/m.3872 type:complete len:87 (-) Transcript_2913:49-309(-)